MTLQRLSSVDEALAFLRQRVGGQLRIDSRAVQPGDGFIALQGYHADGRAFVQDALARGAAACVVEVEGDAAGLVDDDRVAALAGLKAHAGALASLWLGEPSRHLKVLSVTGTNGKTSTAWWLAHALQKLSKQELLALDGCGLIGTLGVGIAPDLQATGLTTPNPLRLQQVLADFVRAGVGACAIEASSIGIAEQRLAGTQIDTALFTNLTQDHLDYHGSMQAYWEAKRALFDWPGLRAAVVNIDDEHGAALHRVLAARALDLWSVAVDAPARLRAVDLHHGATGLAFTVVEGGERVPLSTRLVGQYNVSNLLGVIAALRSLGVSLAAACGVCADLEAVPGRMQQVTEPGQPLAVVDYAHTPDALAKVLAALRPLAQGRGGRLWCVFGCGGDRDALKRPLMGAAAQQGADRVIVTSDNPRSEEAAAIVHQILQGMIASRHVQAELDRATAIAQALAQADARDVVLIAGKGHEPYQEIAGVRRPFSDLEQARLALARRAPQLHEMATLQQAWELIRARVPQARLVGDGALAFTRVHTDTRTLAPGDLFVALKGERFDAHDFLPQARSAGAAAAIAHGGLAAAGLAGIEVPDTLAALAALATGWRARFDWPLIAVTGSNGKTTVTQMIASILRAWQGDAALATSGNFNNAVGVPLTLLRLRAGHRAAVVELGMNHPGEIAELAAMAQPTVALVNNAQREHQEFMHGVEAVARENGAVLQALPPDGVAVFPAFDVFTPLWRELAGSRRCITFASPSLQPSPQRGEGADTHSALPPLPLGEGRGEGRPAQGSDVHCPQAQWQGDAWAVQIVTPQGAFDTRLQIAGEHNLGNALAATACAVATGVPLAAVAEGLAQFRPVAGRSRAFTMRDGARELVVVDDTYNANPDSVRAAIDVLASLPAPRLLVLGDMGEVGSQGPEFHAEAGDYAKEHGVTRLYALGALTRHAVQSFGAGAEHFDAADALIAATRAALPTTGSVLVKGSRFMRMERVVRAIEEAAA